MANEQLAVTWAISPAQHAVLDYGVAATFFGLGISYRNRSPRASALAAFHMQALSEVGVVTMTDWNGQAPPF